MPTIAKTYVRVVDRFNYLVGRVVMCGIFVLMAVLMWSTFSKQAFIIPSYWALEMAQYILVAYYLFGGAYSIQLGANVRMDLFYDNWSTRKKAWIDCFTVFMLIFYLGVMLYGGIDSMVCSIETNQRSASLWRSYIWPVKAVMCTGIAMMLLQAISKLIKDVATLRGKPL
ncbi:MAG: TRAP transporter small permease subunit [Rhodobacteraceae bacterium]|nr:TRAP transporter small permease subunit [Paracoccaceae bacterium]